MFERLRRWLGGGVKLGTDDREVIYTTTNSDDLARSILQTAQETAKDAPRGAEVTTILSEKHRDVHHIELMLSLMQYAPEYGLEVVVQADDAHTFRKL